MNDIHIGRSWHKQNVGILIKRAKKARIRLFLRRSAPNPNNQKQPSLKQAHNCYTRLKQTDLEKDMVERHFVANIQGDIVAMPPFDLLRQITCQET
jgi:hypothetical protein